MTGWRVSGVLIEGIVLKDLRLCYDFVFVSVFRGSHARSHIASFSCRIIVILKSVYCSSAASLSAYIEGTWEP